MAKKYNWCDSRSSDLSLKWLTQKYGDDWKEWRELAGEWMSLQVNSISNKLSAFSLFFEAYLVDSAPWASDVRTFFSGIDGERCSTDLFKASVLKNTNRSDNSALAHLINKIVQFLDWVLDSYYSKTDIDGNVVREFNNPITRLQAAGQATQTIYNPLPYRYIKRLRSIICPNPKGCFRDWKWAQEQTGQKRNNIRGDWFDAPYEQIDQNDPDCVWREKIITRNVGGKVIPVKVYEIWNPARAMALFITLHLPLRSHQVLMLDSGEADTWRYENGEWFENTIHGFALGNISKPYSKGVFRKIADNVAGKVITGLYINTNKTADIGKDESERGYTIPWENKEVLYWLNRLRNWQEKYNPIVKPTDCQELEVRHTTTNKSREELSGMGYICFLFRNRSSKQGETDKPLTYGCISMLWYQLLFELENKLYSEGDTYSNGQKKKFVKKDSEHYKNPVYFPLHSLRVSLITSYAMEGKLPFSVISKLLAGHTRLLTTYYYNRLTPSVMALKMDEAHEKIQAEEAKTLKLFLRDAELRRISEMTAYSDGSGIETALINRNPAGWEYRHIGLCLVGGNSTKNSCSKSIGSCWNGGPALSASDGNNNHDMVPHGPENCVRCRWFITDAQYLPALFAHLNLISFKVSEAIELANSLESEIESLNIARFNLEVNGGSFRQYDELQGLQRRYEKQVVEGDLYIEDWAATMLLIRRIMEIERSRNKKDQANKIIAVGSENDLRICISETDSRLLQLALICEDAEYYPDMLDDVKKTPVIQDRTQELSKALVKKGYKPDVLLMDSDQQLAAGNAFFRKMAKAVEPGNVFEGFRKAVNYIELEQYLLDDSLFKQGVEALDDNCQLSCIKLISEEPGFIRREINTIDQGKVN